MSQATVSVELACAWAGKAPMPPSAAAPAPDESFQESALIRLRYPSLPSKPSNAFVHSVPVLVNLAMVNFWNAMTTHQLADSAGFGLIYDSCCSNKSSIAFQKWNSERA